MSINAFAEARLNTALLLLDLWITDRELPATRHAELLRVRGELVAMRQLLEMEANIADTAADTQRCPVKLTVVR